MVTEYRLKVGDTSKPESRLEFLKSLQNFLEGLMNDGIIDSYLLATPYGSTCIFKVTEEASS